jgi:NADPH:quinone reductase-like Zn-dependent oxidoreductase
MKGGGRIVTGLRKPKAGRLGVDVAGKVEAVGRNVTQFKLGDAVFGVCVSARKPRLSECGSPRGRLPSMRVLPSPHWSRSRIT